MARDITNTDSEILSGQNAADALTSEERVLAYLRAAMLESGDDPRAIAAALGNVELARAKLLRRDPLRAMQDGTVQGAAAADRPSSKLSR